MNDPRPSMTAVQQGLFMAAGHADVRAESLLNQMQGQDPNLRNRSGMTLLMAAARQGSVEHVRALRERCDPLAVDQNRMTALMWAINAPSLEGVRLLLTREAAAMPADDGCTPLMLAAANADAAMVELLLPFSDPHAVSGKGWTALMYAANQGDAERLRVLLPVSPPEACDRQQNTAWLIAARSASVERLTAMIGRVNHQALDAQGNTALILAVSDKAIAERTRQQAVRALLPVSDPTVVNGKGLCALDMAVSLNAPDLVKELVAVTPREMTLAIRDRWALIKPSAANALTRAFDQAVAASVRRERKALKDLMKEVANQTSPDVPTVAARGRPRM